MEYPLELAGCSYELKDFNRKGREGSAKGAKNKLSFYEVGECAYFCVVDAQAALLFPFAGEGQLELFCGLWNFDNLHRGVRSILRRSILRIGGHVLIDY